MKTGLKKSLLLLAGLCTLGWLAGCDGESLLLGYDCIASDGTSTDSIEVIWDDLSKDGGELPESYTVERSEDDLIYTELTTVTTTSYTDSAVIPGKTYYYQVYATYADASVSDTTDTNSGFAMDAAILPIGSAAGAYTLSGNAGPGETEWDWYKIMAQKGWTYTVYTYQYGGLADTHIYLYAEDDITSDLANDDQGGTGSYSSLTYTFSESGVYYIRVLVYVAAGSYNISMWHHPDIP